MIEQHRWNEQEIKKAAKIILNAENKKSTFVKILDETVHWIILLVILLGNAVISWVIIIISNLINAFFLYILILIFAVSFGLMMEIPLQDLEKLSKHKHRFVRIMLPILAGLNIFIFIGVEKSVRYYQKIGAEFNLALAASIYGLLFIMPHFLLKFLKKTK